VNDVTDDRLTQLAREVDRKRIKNAMWAATFGAILAVVLLLVLGGLVWHELAKQNRSIERAIESSQEAIAEAQEVSVQNLEILERLRKVQKRDARLEIQRLKEARQERNIQRRQHNQLIRLIRGIIRAAGAGELLEDLPGPIRGGGRGRGDNPPG
jgi:hypothetical protein